MKKFISLLLVLSMSLALVACGTEVPELVKPISLVKAYYTVTRGEIHDTTLYNGYVSPTSSSYFYNGNGSIAEVTKNVGDTVKKGETVITLNAEIDKNIEKLEQKIKDETDIYEYFVEEHARVIRNEKASLGGLGGFDKENKALDIESMENNFAYEDSIRESNIASLKVDLDDLLVLKENSVIKSESDGTISFLSATLEDSATIDGQLALMIADESNKVVSFPLEVSEKLDSFDDYYIQIKDKEYRDFDLRDNADIPVDTEFVLKDSSNINCGDYAALFAITNKAENVLYVPNEAINYNPKTDSYYVLMKGEEEDTKVAITKGIVTANYTEITEGLKEGDEIYYSYDETVYGIQYNHEKAIKGKYTHSVTFSELNKYGLEYIDVLAGVPGKIGKIYIDNTFDVYLTEGDPLFTVFPEVEESKYEQVKNDYDTCVRDYEDKIKDYQASIDNKEEELKNATNISDKIAIERQLNDLKDGFEDFVADLDEEKEELKVRYENYTTWLNGEEVIVTAPITGIFNATITLVTGGSLERKDVVGNMYSIDNAQVFVKDISNYVKYGQEMVIESNKNGEQSTSAGKVYTAFNNYENRKAGGITLICNSDEDFINLYTKVCNINFTDISIDNVILIPKNCLYGDNGKYYVYLAYKDYIVKRNVVPSTEDLGQSNLVWIVSGLNENDEVIDYE